VTDQGEAPEGTTSDEEFDAVKARGALGRYRVMAYVTGTMLLLLCLEMVLKYGAHNDALDWIPRLHGFVYMVYLVTVWDLWSRMRWSWGRLVTMVLAGVVPVMSFVLERRVHADAEARIGAGMAS
jgi:integral membrane protein